MNEQFFDHYFYQLAQQNYEDCFKHLDALQSSANAVEGLKLLATFDMFYYAFNYVSNKDKNRTASLEMLKARVVEDIGMCHESVFQEVVLILNIKLRVIDLYQAITSLPLVEDMIARLTNELGIIESIQTYEVEPYKEVLTFELTIIKNLLSAHFGLTQFNYFNTILSLALCQKALQSWERVFYYKKYSPHANTNSLSEYNHIYIWMLRFFHSLLAKASLYFSEFLLGSEGIGLREYGEEYVTR
mmetsp:Transcript_3222/g.6634  ORF Transcript_3222/g.6634 Transcript_3222/m.6634 type:complete len:244 (-) Transcript_3222:497-1228(-)